MTATLVPGRTYAAAAALLAAVAVWAAHHALAAFGLLTHGSGHRFTAIYVLMYGLLVWQLGFAYLNQPYRVGRAGRRALDALDVAALVPVYNEDPTALRACLESMIGQRRRPRTIVVVDDGSTTGADAYAEIRDWFGPAATQAGIRPVWRRQDNAGKRHAQAAAVVSAPDADVYWTVDSDTISDPHALGELLAPLADPAVQSVAGIVMAANVRSSLLTRFTDLWFVTGQLTDRSSLSVLNAVWVNSGPIAVYRGRVIRDNLDSYLNETFAGRRVPFSDDSMLTLFAMLAGRTVQQPSAFAFALMPEKAGHFLRMFVRWMRGSFIRSLWRMRYLPLRSWAYWLHLIRWATTLLSTTLFVTVAVVIPIREPSLAALPWLVSVPIVIGYAQCLRYLTIRRSDQSTAYQWGTWALAPIAVAWAMLVLRATRWYGVATCWKTGWGTRGTVEVALSAAPVPGQRAGDVEQVPNPDAELAARR
ncbi:MULTISPECIES: glycosyltransferase [unclassified Solwaraspora]|uniref:glycosyltransferase n=1 Tax=unclassified Solwaraspora TaxID=2627926 RepID=UPI00259B311F|nr:glycosyltransferase [Solwaraspora sp. WMMA2056]WJK41978.1 glycosyltransferase [Solwaraspora sp. WMMA2056]